MKINKDINFINIKMKTNLLSKENENLIKSTNNKEKNFILKKILPIMIIILQF